MGRYGLARLVIEHRWGVRVRLVWGLLQGTYLKEGCEDGMREFVEKIEGGHFDGEKREIVESAGRERVLRLIRAKERALEIHDAVWEAVEKEHLAPVMAQLDRSERERARQEQGN